MVLTSHRLCWSIPWKNILYCGQCPFQVVGGHPSCFYFFSAGCSSVKTLIFNSWTSRGGSVRQRHSFYQCVEFQTCMKCNGIRHVRCAPYHPSSNGLAERVVQTFKEAMKKTKGDIDVHIARFLFQYRITPHATTGQSPAQLLVKRQPRSALDLMVPDVGSSVQKNQERQKMDHDRGAHLGWEMQFLCKILMALLSGLQEG